MTVATVATGKAAGSLRALAARLNVSHTSVQKGAASGRLSRSLGRGPDGRRVVLDFELAEQEWHAGASRPRRSPATSRDHGSEDVMPSEADGAGLIAALLAWVLRVHAREYVTEWGADGHPERFDYPGLKAWLETQLTELGVGA